MSEEHEDILLVVCIVVIGSAIAFVLVIANQHRLEMAENNRRTMNSPVLKRFLAVRDALTYKYGKGVSVPCGVTAAAMEAGLEFVDANSLSDIRPGPNTVYRLHFFIDVDNLSDDHVVFLLAGKASLFILHSYTDRNPPRVEQHSWLWLKRVQRMCVTHDTEEWIRLFNLDDDSNRRPPPHFAKPVSNISCYCTFSLVL